MKDEKFNSDQVAGFVDAKPRSIMDYCERGIIQADIQEASGHGSQRLFSRQGVYRVALAYFLKRAIGLPKDRVKFFLDLSGPTDKTDWGKSTLCMDLQETSGLAWIYPGTIQEAMADLATFSTGPRGPAVIFVDLAGIKKGVDYKIDYGHFYHM
jgi:hypothetical protein